MRKGISMEFSERLALERGFLPAPKNHPIYSEGTTITFLRRDRRRSDVKPREEKRRG